MRGRFLWQLSCACGTAAAEAVLPSASCATPGINNFYLLICWNDDERGERAVVFVSERERETEELGARLAGVLRAGDVVALRGGLGMGKTAFVRGMARGLGVTDRVTSPTFTIVNEYAGRLPLFHFDLYRLSGADELFDIGWEDYPARGGVCAVEWGEQAEGALEESVSVSIRRGEGDGQRVIEIAGREVPAQ